MSVEFCIQILVPADSTQIELQSILVPKSRPGPHGGVLRVILGIAPVTLEVVAIEA